MEGRDRSSAAPDLGPVRVEVFRSAGGGYLQTGNPITKAALLLLAREQPRALAFAELLARAQALVPAMPDPLDSALAPQAVLASDLLQAHTAGLLALHADPLQAARGLERVTTLGHGSLRVDASMRAWLQLLDGRRDRAALSRALVGTALAGQDVDALLAPVARAALLLD